MGIRRTWNFLVTAWKRWRPARRRQLTTGFCELLETRRVLSAFVVNSLADSHDANPGDGVAADSNGQTTLRAAIEEANALSGADTIQLPSGTIEIGNDIVQAILVTDAVTLEGTGTSATILDGSARSATFQVSQPGLLTLDNVTVRDGQELPASVRSVLLTTNSRQAELVVAFQNRPTAIDIPVPLGTAGLSSLVGITVPESVLDDTPTIDRSTVENTAGPIPTPAEAIDEVIRALFNRDVTETVKQAGAEGAETPGSKTRSVKPKSSSESPMPAEPRNLKPMNGNDAKNSKVSDEDELRELGLLESSTLADDEAVAAILRQWDQDTRDISSRVETASSAVKGRHRVGMLAGVTLSGWAINSGLSAPSSESRTRPLASWHRRLARLRRRAR